MTDAKYKVTLTGLYWVASATDITGCTWHTYGFDHGGVNHRIRVPQSAIETSEELPDPEPQFVHEGIYRDSHWGNYYQWVDETTADGNLREKYFVTFGDDTRYYPSYFHDTDMELVG